MGKIPSSVNMFLSRSLSFARFAVVVAFVAFVVVVVSCCLLFSLCFSCCFSLRGMGAGTGTGCCCFLFLREIQTVSQNNKK